MFYEVPWAADVIDNVNDNATSATIGNHLPAAGLVGECEFQIHKSDL